MSMMAHANATFALIAEQSGEKSASPISTIVYDFPTRRRTNVMYIFTVAQSGTQRVLDLTSNEADVHGGGNPDNDIGEGSNVTITTTTHQHGQWCKPGSLAR